MRRPRPKRVGRPSTQPRPTRQLLDGTFRWLKLDEQARSFAAMRAFSLAVESAGVRVGEHARAERLRGSILYVRCDSAAWSQHLHVMKALLLDKLRKLPGGEGVQELRFNSGPLDEVATWERAAPEPPTVQPRHAPPPEVARALEEVADDELRAQLARLYGKLGSRGA
jgi:predicted nucleic acid-binding Zn ribbon protein